MSETTPSDEEVPCPPPPGGQGNRAPNQVTKYKYFAYNKQPWEKATWHALTLEQQQVVLDINKDFLLEEYPTYTFSKQEVQYDPTEPEKVVVVTIAYS